MNEPFSQIVKPMKYKFTFEIFLLTALGIFGCSTLPPENLGSFKQRLTEIVSTKDLEGLKAILHDTVFESNDGCGYPGCLRDEFMQFYFRPGIADDWKMLEEIVAEGFIRIDPHRAIVRFENVDSVYEAPKYLRQIDNSTQLMVLSDKLDIKDQPDISAETIGSLSRNVILDCTCCIMDKGNDFVRNRKGEQWIRVKHQGNIGYVQGQHTSQRDSRILEIALIDQKWKIISWFIGECR